MKNKKVYTILIVMLLILVLIFGTMVLNLTNKVRNIEKKESSQLQLSTTTGSNAYISTSEHLEELNQMKSSSSVKSGEACLIYLLNRYKQEPDSYYTRSIAYTALDLSNISDITVTLKTSGTTLRLYDYTYDNALLTLEAPLINYTIDLSKLSSEVCRFGLTVSDTGCHYFHVISYTTKDGVVHS